MNQHSASSGCAGRWARASQARSRQRRISSRTARDAAFDDAVASERKALEAWKQLVDAAGDLYSKHLAFGAHAVGFSRHWEEEYKLLTREFETLLSETRLF